ncbi:MAG: acyl carrier protein [Gammaproteobacteria bacterium]
MNATLSTKARRVKQALGQSLARKPEELADEILLKNLVAESFALIETVIDLQEELGIRLLQEDLRDVETVGDLVRVCAERLD